ncbi:hypothetical protein L6164_013143 [Bauhinia variegata]|uniref:Uncharacterized protein n=1 Tax=Bauhinia variegata TaxID=167791 RepID=A0ACB9PCI4_BAUVA|nr:hypothetical protein L6164_013143 [Bauhinia variegata]
MEKSNKINQNDGVPSSSPGSSERKASSQKEREVLPPELQQHIGRVLCKDSNGKQDFGTVISYNNDTELFIIKYGEEFEDVDESEILKMLTTNNHHVEDLLRLELLMLISLMLSLFSTGFNRSAARMDTDPDEPKWVSQRASAGKKSQKNTSTDNYVPRASGSWKDDYYWY